MKAVHFALCGEGKCPDQAQDILHHIAAQFEQLQVVGEKEPKFDNYGELNPKYIHNVVVAKNTACSVLQTLYDLSKLEDYAEVYNHFYFVEEYTDEEGEHHWTDILKPGLDFFYFFGHFPQFLEYCGSKTGSDIRKSTFYELVYKSPVVHNQTLLLPLQNPTAAAAAGNPNFTLSA
jgi:hypothetical protein